MTDTRSKGSSAEDTAADHLVTRGYRIVARNYQARDGEIDIIAEDPAGCLVFAEVKSSQGPRYGHPFHRITRAKQRIIARVARRYLAEHGLSSIACRFDAIAVRGQSVEHLRNAFIC